MRFDYRWPCSFQRYCNGKKQDSNENLVTTVVIPVCYNGKSTPFFFQKISLKKPTKMTPTLTLTLTLQNQNNTLDLNLTKNYSVFHSVL